MNTAADPSADLDPAPAAVDTVDSSYLQTLVGYNARMAALAVIGHILPGMARFGLRIVDFSILSIIFHNPGITSKQLCGALNLLPPNLVGKIGTLEKRGLLVRHPHPQDGRALGLQLTAEGRALMHWTGAPDSDARPRRRSARSCAAGSRAVVRVRPRP